MLRVKVDYIRLDSVRLKVLLIRLTRVRGGVANSQLRNVGTEYSRTGIDYVCIRHKVITFACLHGHGNVHLICHVLHYVAI